MISSLKYLFSEYKKLKFGYQIKRDKEVLTKKDWVRCNFHNTEIEKVDDHYYIFPVRIEVNRVVITQVS